jgi:hypothetical protein
MNEQPALPPPTPSVVPDRSALAIACATVIILGALGAGGYVLQQELARMANAKPVAPPEVTQALKDLRTQLEQQRADSATQLNALQNELASVKEQQAAIEPPDVDAAIAPVQEKLDAIVAQLQEAPVAVVEAAAPETVVETPAAETTNALRDYLALRRTVERGQPYAAELAALIPHVPESELAAITTLQLHAEQGIGADDEEIDAPANELKPWMRTVNEKLEGMVSIKPSRATQATPQARAEVIAALDRIEASLMSEQ